MEKAEVIKKLKELKPLLQKEFSITEIGLFAPLIMIHTRQRVI
jgi:hypothetical protein